MELEIDLEGFLLRAKSFGNEDGQPVIGIHGWLDNASSFDHIASSLSPDIHFIALDLAGHGLSDHKDTNSSYYLWDHAQDVLKAIDQLGLQKVSILAHSMGTGIASIIAAGLPHLVEKMVFIDGLGAPFVTSEEEVVAAFAQSIRHHKMARKSKIFGFSSPSTYQYRTKEEAIHDRMNNQVGTISYHASSCLTERSLVAVADGYRWRYDPRLVLPECFRMSERQAQSFISAISCETLIVLGRQGLFSNGMFHIRLSKFQNAKVQWMEGGHHLHLEQKNDTLSQLINEFLLNPNTNEKD